MGRGTDGRPVDGGQDDGTAGEPDGPEPVPTGPGVVDGRGRPPQRGAAARRARVLSPRRGRGRGRARRRRRRAAPGHAGAPPRAPPRRTPSSSPSRRGAVPAVAAPPRAAGETQTRCVIVVYIVVVTSEGSFFS